jgi:hypothetical protein
VGAGCARGPEAALVVTLWGHRGPATLYAMPKKDSDRDADGARPEVVEAAYRALLEMDPTRLAALTARGITPVERERAEFLVAATLELDDLDRRSDVWDTLITREWPSPPTWEELFDDLTPERAARLGELYDALPGGARAEYDSRYGRPQDL